ncbi:pentatricopeptide repeat-containing protein At4g25270, chloroplastic [Aristolochia californica]|uniref:pentatricopeptide repeat-containing protein At4g25270, chloroplastic n=1 Tax=Aristolochia californica TaxID=171875 RepID=UPI0035E0A32E
MADAIFTPSVCLSSSSKRQRNKHRGLGGRTHFPRSTSLLTPLIINQSPFTQTKHQALDQVVEDLRSSVSRGIKIEPQIFSSLLETCFRLKCLHNAVQLHRLVPPNLLRKSTDLSSKLLRLYAFFGRVEDAHRIFDSMSRRDGSAFAWNSLISGYVELGMCEDALALYFQMEEEGVEPDEFTFPRVLKACSGLGSIQVGEAVHRHVVRSGFGTNLFVLNALVDMYAKCGDIVKARKVFDKLSHRDSVSWNSMFTGYIRHGLLIEAVDVFRMMLNSRVEPDSIAISTAVTGTESLKLGLEIHGWVIRHGAGTSLSVANSLITMYAKNDRIHLARAVFDEMPERDIVSWNAMIQSYAEDPEALTVFESMEESGQSPDSVTFVSLLSTCAKLGLVEDGRRLFRKMKETYKISAGMEHYSCMVNLLGRAGLVEEAYGVIERMGFEAGPTVWGALLFACFVHGNVEYGELAGERLFELEPDNAHNFELLMNIYRNAGKLEEEEKVRRLKRERGLDF